MLLCEVPSVLVFFTFGLAIIVFEIASALISLISAWPSLRVRSHRLSSLYFQLGHHLVGAVVRPRRGRSPQLLSLQTVRGRSQGRTETVGDHEDKAA